MQDKSLNIYPNLREQLFLYDKGNYWEYRFDLGAAPRIDRIIIAWPSGIEQIIFDPPTGQSITLHNPPQ